MHPQRFHAVQPAEHRSPSNVQTPTSTSHDPIDVFLLRWCISAISPPDGFPAPRSTTCTALPILTLMLPTSILSGLAFSPLTRISPPPPSVYNASLTLLLTAVLGSVKLQANDTWNPFIPSPFWEYRPGWLNTANVWLVSSNSRGSCYAVSSTSSEARVELHLLTSLRAGAEAFSTRNHRVRSWFPTHSNPLKSTVNLPNFSIPWCGAERKEEKNTQEQENSRLNSCLVIPVGQGLKEPLSLLGAQDIRPAQAQMQWQFASQVALEVALELEGRVCGRGAFCGYSVEVVQRIKFCSRQVPSSSPSASDHHLLRAGPLSLPRGCW